MMGLGLQDVLVAALAVAAIAYLVRRRRQRSQPKKSEIVTLGRAPKRGSVPSGPVAGP
ncbi:MAG: hypothetical protein HY944_02440 [Gemmatimonadetes bacterium]|nr:hypothetical protein [Gemmatimonadota bacterium]